MQRKRKQHTCMFDWQATQTQPCLFSTLSKGESHFRSLVCIMRNSKYASTSIMCTLRNSNAHFELKFKIRNLPSCENSLSLLLEITTKVLLKVHCRSCYGYVMYWYACFPSLVGFTRIAVNFKFHSWFANFQLT